MAKIGLNNFRYSILTEDTDGKATYAGAKIPAKAIDCKVNICLLSSMDRINPS